MSDPSTNGHHEPQHGPDPIADLKSPWEILSRLKAEVPMADRGGYLEPWLLLLLKESRFAREALIAAGKEVWGYPVQLARERIRELEKMTGSEKEPHFAAFLTTDTLLAEMVYRPKLTPNTGFLVWKRDGDEEQVPEFVEKIELEDKIVFPFGPRVVRDRTIFLPETVEEYDTPASLFATLREYLTRYVQVESNAILNMAAAYILMSWVYDRFFVLPYLRATGDFGSGKSTLIKVVGLACYRPTLASGALTAAALFRIADQMRGTLVIDEADFSDSEMWSEITKILNGGFESEFRIYRTERAVDGDGWDVRGYNVYGPKLLATRRNFRDQALESRCLTYSLPLVDVKPTIPLFLDRTFFTHVQAIRNRLLLWRFRTWGRIEADPLGRITGMEPRLNQTILPILSCADHDPILRHALLKAAFEHSSVAQRNRQASLEGQIVAVLLREWARKAPAANRLLLKTVTDRLRMDEDTKDVKPQKVSNVLNRTLGVKTEYKGGNAWITLTPVQVAHLAKQYGVEADPETVPDPHVTQNPGVTPEPAHAM